MKQRYKLHVGIILVGTWGLLTAAAWAQKSEAELRLGDLKLTEGFQIEVYATGIREARSMVRGSAGTLFVGTRRLGKVYALVDKNGDHRADETFVIAEGLFMPNGVAFRDGSLYVAEVNRVLRFDNIESRLQDPPEPVVVRNDLPSDRHHGWKFIDFGPDGKLYVPVGAPCNICERLEDERYSSILRMNADGSGLEVFAHGVRNTVGFDWHPVTGELWFTDNGRDHLGDNLPPDELNRATEAGQHFGYPYCHGGFLSDPEFGHKRPCSEFQRPAYNLGPHVAALGAEFYTGSMFPAEYRNQLFVAEHGSWNRSTPLGYRLMLIRILDNTQAVYDEIIAEGWLQGEKPWGRPVDLLQLPDGSLLLSDDLAGAIYRITYQEPVSE